MAGSGQRDGVSGAVAAGSAARNAMFGSLLGVQGRLAGWVVGAWCGLWVMGGAWAQEVPAIGGRWVLVDDPQALKARQAAAVDEAVASLNFALRPIARHFLTHAVKNCGEMALRLDDSVFGLRCDAQSELRRTRTGPTPNIVGVDGEPYAFGLFVNEQRVLVDFSGEKGGERSTFRITEGGLLKLSKEIYSEQLPAPIRWAVTYRKVD